MTSTIQLANCAGGTAGSKGVLGAMKRAISGGTFFMTDYSAVGGPGVIAFATKVPRPDRSPSISMQQRPVHLSIVGLPVRGCRA